MWHDFCPLCGARFIAESSDELCKQIIAHMEDGTCERNFRPPEIVLNDNGQLKYANFVYEGKQQ